MNDQLIWRPADFVAIFNQSLERLYPSVVIEGELADFSINRGRWVYFNVKDELASLKFFGSVHSLPGPLTDGLSVRVLASPRLHPQFGFSLNFTAIQPVGEGAIKKAADLLRAKLTAEGLFAPERKRPLPAIPARIGLITAAASAAAADFLKILNERWGGVEVLLLDTKVQGSGAPLQLSAAINHFEQISPLADVLVITRGGGSAEDLAAFNDERVVRAIAGSRTPTLVAIGHEVDESLAELAADRRASTPTNAAGLVVPDRRQLRAEHQALLVALGRSTRQLIQDHQRTVADGRAGLKQSLLTLLQTQQAQLAQAQHFLKALNPQVILRRGYALVRQAGRHLNSVKQVRLGQPLAVQLHDGAIAARVEGVTKN